MIDTSHAKESRTNPDNRSQVRLTLDLLLSGSQSKSGHSGKDEVTKSVGSCIRSVQRVTKGNITWVYKLSLQVDVILTKHRI